MGERGGAYRVLAGKPEEMKRLGRPRLMWEDNIKTELQEVGWGNKTGLIWFRIGIDGWLVDCCECGNGTLGFVKCWEPARCSKELVVSQLLRWYNVGDDGMNMYGAVGESTVKANCSMRQTFSSILCAPNILQLVTFDWTRALNWSKDKLTIPNRWSEFHF